MTQLEIPLSEVRTGDVIVRGPGPYEWVRVERPEPPKPKVAVGAIGIATVRRIPGVQVMRLAGGGWATAAALWAGGGHYSDRHGDTQVTDFQELHVLTDEELAEVGYAREQIAKKELLKEIEDFALGVHDSYYTEGEYRLGARNAARTIVYRLADYLRALREESK